MLMSKIMMMIMIVVLLISCGSSRRQQQEQEQEHQEDKKTKEFTFHFVHVPKSGGSTVTAYLRQYVNCQPPGFCCTAPGLPVGTCNETRLCSSIIGCTRHDPHIELLRQSSVFSVLSIREPLARAVSGFRYPYHHSGHKQFASFVLDKRYQNVAVKMLNGMQPYADVHVQSHHLSTALDNVEKFDAIILTEALEDCIHALFHILPGQKQPQPVPIVRPALDPNTLFVPTEGEVALFQSHNEFDIQLYEQAVRQVCTRWKTELDSFCKTFFMVHKEQHHNNNNNNSSDHDIHWLEERAKKSEAWAQKRLQQHAAGKYPVPNPLPWTPPQNWLHGLSCHDAYFHHYPGHYKGGRDPAVAAYFKESKDFGPPPARVLFAFPYASNNDNVNAEDSLAERMYKHLQYPYINYLEGEHSFQRWWSKVGPLMELVAGDRRNSKLTHHALLHQYDYIVVHDASDVLLVQSPKELIQRFETYDCDILMGTTDADWPPEPALRDFESGVAPWSKRHAHITAGMFMARLSTLLELMKDLVEESKSFRGSFNDQRHWRRLHGRAYPRVKADSCCRIFARKDEFMNAP